MVTEYKSRAQRREEAANRSRTFKRYRNGAAALVVLGGVGYLGGPYAIDYGLDYAVENDVPFSQTLNEAWDGYYHSDAAQDAGGTVLVVSGEEPAEQSEAQGTTDTSVVDQNEQEAGQETTAEETAASEVAPEQPPVTNETPEEEPSFLQSMWQQYIGGDDTPEVPAGEAAGAQDPNNADTAEEPGVSVWDVIMWNPFR